MRKFLAFILFLFLDNNKIIAQETFNYIINQKSFSFKSVVKAENGDFLINIAKKKEGKVISRYSADMKLKWCKLYSDSILFRDYGNNPLYPTSDNGFLNTGIYYNKHDTINYILNAIALEK